jgi:MFS transporter, SP family, solute carrier family 2 (myo-inositol transporter), member 13
MANFSSPAKRLVYNRFLLLVAGLGGLLYGIDVGIIGGALPYLEATSKLTRGQLSIIVAAVLLGSVFTTLFAGMLADLFGRKPMMVISGCIFVLSIPVIALSQSYGALFMGRMLQGVSGGFVGVVVPLYLAECLPASTRGKGTGVFQWLLTLGIVFAAIIGIYYSYRVAEVSRVSSAMVVLAVKNQAWRRIFWMCMPPGILFLLGSLFVAESPRWLYKRGKREGALTALLRSHSEEQAESELREMDVVAVAGDGGSATVSSSRPSLLSRQYVIPFLLACVILFCSTATGVNSIIGYNTDILIQSGLSDVRAHWGYVVFTVVNFLMTVIGLLLVDRKGRKFLFVLGTSGIIASLLLVATLFLRTEGQRQDVGGTIQKMAMADQRLTLTFNKVEAQRLMASNRLNSAGPVSLSVIYSYGGFTATSSTVRSDDAGEPQIEIDRANCVAANKVEAFFRNPFVSLEAARTAPLRIEHAYLATIPSATHGWLVALGLYGFIGFYALGPGVCVWLALSELMPTRIRSNGMSIALVINQMVSTTLAAIFLPVVGKYGYSTMFFLFTGFTVIYLLTVALFLPETKGKTLEEIEEHFRGL